jgi:iron complex outermembrane receptor protein
MKTKPFLSVIISGFLILLLTGTSLWGQEQEKEKEDLLFEDIPVVITAARKEQPITESPSTITVISSEDIRLSGATNIPDVLRMTAGVDVMAVSMRDQQVSVRGLNSIQSNKLLVMIDGRSVYIDLYGSVFWDLFPIGIEEIERIEVVKSPVSSLYGANAYNGMVNIITQTPEQAEGTQLRLTAGNYSGILASFLRAGTHKKISYRVSGEWDRSDEWNWNDNPCRTYKFNALLDYNLGKKSRVTLSGGRSHTENRNFFVSQEIGDTEFSGAMDYLRLEYQYANFKFRTFFNRMDADIDFGGTINMQNTETSTFDAEILHSFKIGKIHSFVWGANYRHNKIKKGYFFPQSHSQDLWALFFEDEIKLTDDFRVTVGGRYDRHPLVGSHFSPRGNLFFSLSPKHIIRFSVAKAYRNPAFVNSYLYLEYPTMVPLPEPFSAITVPFTFIIMGDDILESEGIVAFEFGYRTNGIKGIELTVNLFHNDYSKLFNNVNFYEYYGANEIFPGSPGGVITKRLINRFQNGGDARGIGGEIHLDIKFNDYLSGFLNYSYVKITHSEDDPRTAGFNEKDKVNSKFPKHKVNAGLRFKFKNGVFFNCLMHWVDKTRHHIHYVDGNEYVLDLNDYLICNAAVGYRYKNVEVSLAAFNLFNNKHYQYPPGIDPAVPWGYQVARRINFTVRYTF